MKRIVLIAMLFVAYLVPSTSIAQEVTYVEDPSQGYLFNRMRDNWFIDAEGGVVYTIEGNSSDSVAERSYGLGQGCVMGYINCGKQQ